MEGKLYDKIVESYCFDNFYFENVRLEQPNGLLKTTTRDYELIVFNSKKIIFFTRLENELSKTEVICKLRGALSSLVNKFLLSLNDFVVCGANSEKVFFLNKHNDLLYSFDRLSDECFKIIEHIENDLSYGGDVFDYFQFKRLSDILILSPCSGSYSKTKEKVKTDTSGNTFVNVHGAWREASTLDTEALYNLTVFGGMFGFHLFYQKKNLKGVFYLFTLGLCGVGWFFDCLEILLGIYKDPDGKYLIPLEGKLSGFLKMLFGAGVFAIGVFVIKLVFGVILKVFSENIAIIV